MKRSCWMNPKLKVMKVGETGKGVFVMAPKIKQGEILAIHAGYLITRAEEDLLPDGFNDYGLQISEDFAITSANSKKIGEDSFFNHSCDPNAGYKGQIVLVAMRNIKIGEEITFDYGTVLFRKKGAKPYKLRCDCGYKNCRGYITDNDWKKKELQEKYNGYFQWYLQERINKMQAVC